MENMEYFSKITQIENDIKEIESYFLKPFDRQEAIRIIKKHHFTDMNIAIADMLFNCNASTLAFELPSKINTYIGIIEIYLTYMLDNLRKARSNTNA